MSDFLDESYNDSTEPHFREVLGSALGDPARRAVLRGGVGLTTLLGLGFEAKLAIAANGTSGAQGTPPDRAASISGLGFEAVEKGLADRVSLPPGYRYQILHATGDTLDAQVPAYGNQGLESDDWSRRIGDHHDGIELFFVDAQGKYSERDTGRALLCVNHESSADAHFLHPRGQSSNGAVGRKFTQFGDWDLGARPAEEVLKEIHLHGVSVVEVVRTGHTWRYRVDSPYNRRITPNTPMRVSAPAACLEGVRAHFSTRFDPSGARARGTLNNCGSGKTPWGTYLTCEENWAFYFHLPVGAAAGDSALSVSRKRYGVQETALAANAKSARGQGWHTVSSSDDRFARWNIAASGVDAASDFRQEPNTFGYIVEIDPCAPSSAPTKRTAMGRFAHEAAICAPAVAGAPLVFYMGCDSRNEYIYKFVSAAHWDPRDVGGGQAAGDRYLNEGKLYVARFDADGSGRWLELTIADPKIAANAKFKFNQQADVLVHTRLAADALGATPMDRPEWGAVNPKNGEIYFSLTNNNAANRSPDKVNAANPRAYADADGKKLAGNPNGHIIRFREDADRHSALGFRWDVFLFGAESDMGPSNLSELTPKNDFSSPDGVWFSRATGICWIETDDNAMTDESNCMLLAAIPGRVGDGSKITVNNNMLVGGTPVNGQQETFVGATLGETRLRRFLVAPRGSEVTGLTESPDGRALFLNIQHPGEETPALGNADAFKLQSEWPGNEGYGPKGRPRSATIVITREDGGLIGL